MSHDALPRSSERKPEGLRERLHQYGIRFGRTFAVIGALQVTGAIELSARPTHAADAEVVPPEFSPKEREGLQRGAPARVEQTPEEIVLHYESEAGKTIDERLPGDEARLEGRLQFQWGLDDFSRAQAGQVEQEALRVQIRQVLDAYLDQYQDWGLAPEDLIRDIQLTAEGDAGSDGRRLRPDLNTQLAVRRGDVTAQLVREELRARGLGAVPLQVEVTAAPSENGLEQFMEGLERELAYHGSGTSQVARAEMAERIIDAIHDNSEVTLERLIPGARQHMVEIRRVYEETIAQHYSARMELTLHTKDLVVRHDARKVLPPLLSQPAERPHRIPVEILVPLLLPLLLRRRPGEEEEKERPEPAPEPTPQTPSVTSGIRSERQPRAYNPKKPPIFSGASSDFPERRKKYPAIPANVRAHAEVSYRPYVKHIGTKGAGMRRAGMVGRL